MLTHNPRPQEPAGRENTPDAVKLDRGSTIAQIIRITKAPILHQTQLSERDLGWNAALLAVSQWINSRS